MRVLEILLILANVISLTLGFTKLSKRAWFAAAGVNLSVFLIHAVFEGLRYQMAFSYAFVFLFAVVTFVKTKDRFFTARTPGALKAAAISVSLLLLGLTAVLAYALPVFQLPQPTGGYPVGIQYLHLIDENRADPFLDGSAKPRELMVKVYYPASEDASKPFSPYFHSPRLVRLLAAFYGMPEFAFDQLNLVKTHSKEALPVSDQQQRYPVILFSHGAGTTMEVQTSQSEDLASHGYIVAAIDHTYASAGTVFPDRIVSAKEATTNFDVAEPAEIIIQIMAEDASFVIDQLAEMNAGEIESVFRGKLDMERLGAVGHSVGGAVAYNLGLNDRRVRAAVDLDGVVYVTPNLGAQDAAPFLMLANDQYHIQAIEKGEPLLTRFEDMDEIDQKITVEIYGSKAAYEDAYEEARQNVTGLTGVVQSSGKLFTIQGSDHMKFIDIGLFIALPQLRELIGIGGKTDSARCLEITKALTLAFFDQHLKDAPAAELGSLVEKYPELEEIHLR